MPNSKKRCSQCKKYFPVEQIKIRGSYRFCSPICEQDFAVANFNKLKAKGEKIKAKNDKAKLESLKPRTQWLDKLQILVNQYVRQVRDKDKPCCTCGASGSHIKYDAGHFHSRRARSDLRFELTNIHKQCSVACNQMGSGMRFEYAQFIVDTYGQEKLDWLAGEHNHKSLKEQFPTIDAIKAKIIEYRILLREHGVKPQV